MKNVVLILMVIFLAIGLIACGKKPAPSSLQELVEKGYAKELPSPPEGMSFKYNPDNGSIRLE